MSKFSKLLAICTTFIIATFAFSVPISQAVSQAPGNIYEGIDVSQWQGGINFEQVKNAGIDIVYIKSSEGANFVDPYFERNYENAKANGLQIGFYHFVTAKNTQQAELQARFFASVISGKEVDCRLAMDFEQLEGLSASQVNEISEVFLSTLTSLTGKETVIYSDLSNAESIFSRELASRYPLWLAYYGNYTELARFNTSWSEWIGLQYSDTGRVAGINGYVDRDKFTSEILLSDSSSIPQTPIPEESNNTVNEVTYVVQRGDTLSSIAQRYNTTVSELVSLNNIQNPNLIFAGERLVIRRTSGINASDRIMYTVQRGDTLSSIAQRYNTTVSELVSVNNIQNPNLIFPGERLEIVTETQKQEDVFDTNHTIYTIKPGDTLSQIAREYDTTVSQIVRLNNIQNPNLIFAGERIRI